VARWFRGGLVCFPTLSVAGALMSLALLRFHIPLIKPDVRFSRIRLSDKDSHLRPREVARSLAEADEPQFLMQAVVRET